MKGKMKVIALAMALVIGSVAILTGSLYALADVPEGETEYDRSDFVDESLLASTEEPAAEPGEAVEGPVVATTLEEALAMTKIEVTDEGTWVEGRLIEGTVYGVLNFYALPRTLHPDCPALGYADIDEKPVVWVLSEILECFVDGLGYEYDYTVDWAFTEAEWRGNILVVDVDLGEKIDSYKSMYEASNVEPVAEESATEEPVEEPADDEVVAEPVEDPTDDEAIEEPAEEPAEEPVEEPTEEPVEEPAEEPVAGTIPPYDPSEGVPEELWDFCYVVGQFLQWYEVQDDGSYALVIENRSEQDVIVTYYTSYSVIDYDSPDFHWEYEHGDVKFGISGDAPRIKIGSETTIVEIAAGEKGYVFFDQELRNASDGAISGIISVVYGDHVVTQPLPA